MDPRMAVELVNRYNADPRSFTDQEAEMIAQIAQAIGMPFPRENKPIRKGLFDLADIGSWGLLPNEWRPTSRGETAFGETGLDKFAGGAGTVAGLPLAALTGVGAGMAGAAAGGAIGTRLGATAFGGAMRKGAINIGKMARGSRGLMPGAGQAGAGVGAFAGRAGAYGQNLAQMLRNLRAQTAAGWRQGRGGYGPGIPMPARSFTGQTVNPLLTAGV
jgi:hypothetical protein